MHEKIVHKNVPSARLTRFQTGGLIDRLTVPKTRDGWVSNIKNDNVTVIGGGTNLLIRDGGIRGDTLIFRPENYGRVEFDRVTRPGPVLKCQAGASNAQIARRAAREGLRGQVGLEFLAGIPGTIGGAVAGNAGCFGRSVSDVPLVVCAYDLKSKKEIWLGGDDCEFGYRASIFSSGRYVIDSVALGFDFDAPQIDIRDMMARKRAAQPIGEKTAGSVFKNPESDGAPPAWRLIDACGLRGYQIGGARVSDMHANFIINAGNASSDDIENLIEHIRSAVDTKFGIALALEIKILGEKLKQKC